MANNPLFAGIEDPKSLRKELLEASKAVVHILIQHEQYLELRAKKKKKVQELSKAVNKLIANNKKLHKLLPQTEEAPAPIRSKKEFVPKKKNLVAKKNRLDELKEELSKFEDRLSSLN